MRKPFHSPWIFGTLTLHGLVRAAPLKGSIRRALPTGNWTNRTGVWPTLMGCSMLLTNEIAPPPTPGSDPPCDPAWKRKFLATTP